MLVLIQKLQEWLTASIGDHSYTVVVTTLALTGIIILVYWLFYALVFRGFRSLSRRVLKEDSDVQPLRIQKQEILSGAEVADNYVAYELNASTRRADLRPEIYSDLHANILDAFHTAGVEITSPHYRAIRDGNEPAMAPVIPQSSADPA